MTTVELDKDEVDLEALIEYAGTMGIAMYEQGLRDKEERDDILLDRTKRR